MPFERLRQRYAGPADNPAPAKDLGSIPHWRITLLSTTRFARERLPELHLSVQTSDQRQVVAILLNLVLLGKLDDIRPRG